MSKQQSRTYDQTFKINAVKLYQSSGRSYQQIADEIGVLASALVGWAHSYQKSGEDAFPGKGHIKPVGLEVAQLRKELAIIKEERDRLKKVLGIFSSTRISNKGFLFLMSIKRSQDQ